MKKSIFSLMLLTVVFSVNAQTAVNFNCDDCTAANHDLFTELNAGKVVVICWVMPCGGCLSGALAAQSACNSFSASNPGQVFYYCVDDVANTSCLSLINWCSTNGITGATAKFSNSAISMADYGTSGMPKVVVLGGGSNHTVFYNQNNANISTSGIQTAINNALAATPVGIEETAIENFQLAVFPNPMVNKKATVSYELKATENLTIGIYNHMGEKVSSVLIENHTAGKHKRELDLSPFSAGIYFIQLKASSKNDLLKLVVLD